MLDPRVCGLIFARLDQPRIDLFSAQDNHQLPLHYTRGAYRRLAGADALSQDLSGIIGYAFPPITVIPRVLNKIAQTEKLPDSASSSMVAPVSHGSFFCWIC